MAFNLIIKKGI
ncbi:uncharacterized protein FFC1_11627 [Fusarium fujikuroi]|nr:uncharacterized protein FFC1_11627 [Fusarium fujikuroi]